MGEQEVISRVLSRTANAVALILALAFGLLVAAAAVLASGPLPAPDWLKSRIVSRLDAYLGNESLEIDSLEIFLDLKSMKPAIFLHGVKVISVNGERIAALSSIAADFEISQLVNGRLIPRSLRVPYLQMGIVQEDDGTLSLAVRPSDSDAETESHTLNDFIDSFRSGDLAMLNSIEVEEVELDVHIRSLQRSWQVENGNLIVENRGATVAGEMAFQVSVGDGKLASGAVGFLSADDGGDVLVSGRLGGIEVGDLPLGEDFRGLAGRMDARISVETRANLQNDGKIAGVSGSASISEGTFSYSADRDIPLSGAKFDFSYDPLESRAEISRLLVDSESLKLSGDGYALVKLAPENSDGEIVGGINFREAEFTWPGLEASALSGLSGHVNFRLEPRRPSLEFFGNLSDHESNEFAAAGTMVSGDNGVAGSLKVSSKRLSLEKVLALWPSDFASSGKEWVAVRASGGEASGVNALIGFEPGQGTKAVLTWRFLLDELRIAENLPPIAGAAGFGEITQDTLVLALESGVVNVPGAGIVDVAESSFSASSIHQDDSSANVVVQFGGELGSVLALLDHEPINLLEESGISRDFASGRATGRAILDFPLRADLAASDIDFAASGTGSQIRIDNFAQGKNFFAESLDFDVSNAEISVSGSGSIGNIPISAQWYRRMEENESANSYFAGTMPVSASTLRELGLDLPKNAVEGAQTANFTVDFASDPAPTVVLTSELEGVAISIPAIGWRKRREDGGQLKIISMLLDDGSRNSFEFQARNLSAYGGFEVDSAGSLKRVEFTRVKIGRWLDAPVAMSFSGDRMTVDIGGGVLDLREFDFGSGQGSSSAGTPVALKLDKLIYSDEVALTDVRGNITVGKAIRGRMTGLVNGREEIELALSESRHGTRVDLAARNAGAVLAAAKILEKLYGGTLRASIAPDESEGQSSGRFEISNARAVGMPLLGRILDLISVVGLLEKLDGDGIRFQSIEGDFTIVESGIVFREGSATGPSIGLTYSGGINNEKSLISMKGVITPIYLINGILEQLEFIPKIFGKRKGEGIVAFNYAIKGDSRTPTITVNPASGLFPGVLRDLLSKVVEPSSR